MPLDGHTRVTSLSEIAPGMILREIQSDGSSPAFSDVVVTRTYIINETEKVFDLARPYIFAHLGGELHGVEKIQRLSARALQRYHLVTHANGKPYTMSLDRF